MAVYVVKSGDTMSGIAKAHGMSLTALAALNPQVTDLNEIVVGEEITISGAPPTEVANTTHKVVINRFGLVSGTTRTVHAAWTFDKGYVDHYEYIWYYSWGAGYAEEERGTTQNKYTVFTPPEYATHVSLTVKPVAKTHKVNGVDTAYWLGGWSTNDKSTTYWFSSNPPLTPDTPSVEITDYQLTATLENLQDLNAEYIEFHVYQDNGHLFAWSKKPHVKIVTYHASFTCTIDPGHEYKVQARAWRGEEHSDWSGYSGNQNTKPAASGGITTCRATSSTSIYLEWEAVANADSYDIEYATKREYLEGSDQTTIKSGITSTSYTLAGLQSGSEYFFRVRAANTQGTSAWSDIVSLVIGKPPAAPTTWSSSTVVVSNEELILYWVHNSEDGSKQEGAELELRIIVGSKVNTYTLIMPANYGEEDEEKTSSYYCDTRYEEGATIYWRVRTFGVTGAYGEWSVRRKVDIYGPPTLSINVTDSDGDRVETLMSYPFHITGKAGPSTQHSIGYHVAIIANGSYETVDQIGNYTSVIAGTCVYSKHFDTRDDLDVTLSAEDVDLENNISYTVQCTVTMDSGLTAEKSLDFTVAWDYYDYEPNAELGIDKTTYSAVIRPYCEDGNGELIENVTLGVYRRTAEGSFVKLGSGLLNSPSTYVVDPHPALDYARYRIVAISEKTGSVCYTDLPGYPVGGTSIILQWAERWSGFNVSEDGAASERPWAGSMLMLPYNIDTSENHKLDVAHIEYIGREHPVSYYGTQVGDTATWNTEIPAYDKDTLYALRRLARWRGDVYVREPSGTGYWATVVVSISTKHCATTIPVTLNITRVEGGV